MSAPGDHLYAVLARWPRSTLWTASVVAATVVMKLLGVS